MYRPGTPPAAPATGAASSPRATDNTANRGKSRFRAVDIRMFVLLVFIGSGPFRCAAGQSHHDDHVLDDAVDEPRPDRVGVRELELPVAGRVDLPAGEAQPVAP